ncbi:MAG: undecaprenyl-diphosphate phosphatase [Oligoflexales bacterium]
MEFSEVAYSLALGAVQGITEFLPVSSSAHLIVFSYAVNDQPLPLALNVALHFGTLMAVLVYFRRDWILLISKTLRRIFGGPASYESDVLVPCLFIGTLPIGILGILFEDQIEHYLHNPLFTTVPLALVGFLLWRADSKSPEDKAYDAITIKNAFKIGLAQAAALFPGVSRSGATILTARHLGYNRTDAAKFSFMLGMPAMLGAAALEARHIANSITQPEFYLGFLSSFLVGALTINYLLKFLRTKGFGVFAIYRIALAIVIVGFYVAAG